LSTIVNRIDKIDGARNDQSRMVLGTAQLGMPYGIANRAVQPDFEMVVSIVKTAWEYGIRELDTAQGYGESEAVLGRALSVLGISNDVRIITKIDPGLDSVKEKSFEMALSKSLEHLQVPSLYGLMLHREEWIDLLNDGLVNVLKNFVIQGKVKHIGISLYSPVKAIQALKADVFDMIQIPANILDRRFADAGVFKLAEQEGKQIYIRSIFLQGLLLIKDEDLQPHMAFAKNIIAMLDSLCRKYKLTRRRMALLYIKNRYANAKIIFGAEMKNQIQQNMEDLSGNLPEALIDEIVDLFNNVDEMIINPSRWPEC
jgi:aryl-alcohol dehydrogenase-like predicted oxidoreductase